MIAIQAIEAVVQKEKWPARIQGMWAQVKQAALHEEGIGRENTSSTDMQEIKAQIRGLAVTIKDLANIAILSPSKAPSYAEALRQPAHKLQATKEMPILARRLRELVVAPGAESSSQKQRTGPELIRDINSELQCEAVVAARRLPSGDTLITFENDDSKKRWAKSSTVIGVFDTGARVRTREYTVMAHGVRVATVNTQDQRKAIEEIYSHNPKLKGLIEIVRVGWARKAIQQGKRTAPLHLGIAEPEQANLLIEQGLLYGSELHDYEVYSGDCQVTQCFRCYAYGHTAKHCQSIVRCGFCAAAGHKSNDCPKQEDPQAHRCAICKGGPKHTAWARECPVRRARVEEARQAYLSRPVRFQTRTKLPTAAAAAVAIAVPGTQATTFSYQAPTSLPQSQVASTFTDNATGSANTEAPRKRRRGRATAYEILQRPPSGTQDIRAIFANTPETIFSTQNEQDATTNTPDVPDTTMSTTNE
jgi:hypothetical protein